MSRSGKQVTTVDEYIKAFPQDVQDILQEIRQTIRKVAPEAEETISYAMPTFKLRGKALVHFAAFERHIGFYPTPSGITAFQEALSPYKSAKGSVQFPLDQPVPLPIIRRITEFRVKEVMETNK